MQLAQEMIWDELRPLRKEEAAQREQQFDSLVNRQSAFVFKVAFSILRNVHDAEDVAQEIFLKVYGKSEWDQIQDERAYLARIAWRVAVTRLNGRRDRSPTLETTSVVQTPEELLTGADLTRRLHLLIDALPEELRTPLLLSLTGELTSYEIAAILEIPNGTVRNRLSRARQLLKEKVSRHER